jgi:hypothetical protein
MPENKKKWKGIEVNLAQFQGEIINDPVFNNDFAFLTLRTKYTNRDANGQWVDIPQDIPLMVEPNGPINTVRNYIKAQRKLIAWCYYKSWKTDQGLQHQFVVTRFSLGDKPYEEPEEQSNKLPPLPS